MNKQPQKYLLICIYLFLAAFCLVTYYKSLYNGFLHFDDNEYVSENYIVQSGLTIENIKWAFTTSHASNWHPLTWLSHMLDCQIFGPKVWGHHLVNLLFHIINTLLLFSVFRIMTGGIWRSAFVAAVFAVHPLNVESVAWIAERKNVLSTMFWFLTIWGYWKYIMGKSVSWYIATLLLFAFGLMAKPMLVTLPFVLLILDYWPLGRINNFFKEGKVCASLFIEKIPFFVLSAISSVITFIMQQHGGATVDFEKFGLQVRLANVVVSYVKYIGEILLPINLAVFYPYDENLPMWEVLAALLLLIVISILIIRFSSRYKYLPAGWLWFLGTLVPVIGLVQVGGQALADRYAYIPTIGLFIIISWGVADIARNWSVKKFIFPVSAAVSLAALAVLTFHQLRYWKNDIALFEHAVKVTKNNSVAYTNLSAAYQDSGRYKESIEVCEKAIKISPTNYTAYANLGAAYNELGQYKEALDVSNKAIQIFPGCYHAYHNIGVTYIKMGQYEKAIKAFKEALRIKPDFEDSYSNMADAYSSAGQYENAIQAFKEVIKISPCANSYYNLGATYLKANMYKETIAACTEALKYKPDYPEALHNLGLAYGNLGHYKEAIEAFEKSIKFRPNDAETYYNTGFAYNQLKDYTKEMECYKKAVEIKPDFAEAHYNLGIAYLRFGQKDATMKQYEILKGLNVQLSEKLMAAIDNK